MLTKSAYLLQKNHVFIFQWHRMPTTQETDGFQVKRPGDVNVKCTLLLMLDHQVPLTFSTVTKFFPDDISFFPPTFALSRCFSLISPLSTNWIHGWLAFWVYTHRHEPASCKLSGFTSRTTSCRTVMRKSTSTATAISDR